MVLNNGAQGSLNGTRPHPPISPRTFFRVSTPAPHLSMRAHGAISRCRSLSTLESLFLSIYSFVIHQQLYQELCIQRAVCDMKRVRSDRKRDSLAALSQLQQQKSFFVSLQTLVVSHTALYLVIYTAVYTALNILYTTLELTEVSLPISADSFHITYSSLYTQLFMQLFIAAVMRAHGAIRRCRSLSTRELREVSLPITTNSFHITYSSLYTQLCIHTALYTALSILYSSK